ncbi:Vacuolar ATPase assembly integral membrane like protein [Argiope bruennichi]|uniref:Vacuolar ATPase assembly integral membrane like protein n=1 Tax=Argiope bruennichi TaxID=94029 RepID=A0A8T0EJ55_ARGBR|nr:Vacuolar ATPase assembly integral membrane like protein [Argiope bruennichi]
MLAVKPRNPMLVLLFYSALMVTLPVATFFLSQYAIENYLHTTNSRSYIYATASSVVVIHIILGIFVYYAYKEDKVVPYPPEKED